MEQRKNEGELNNSIKRSQEQQLINPFAKQMNSHFRAQQKMIEDIPLLFPFFFHSMINFKGVVENKKEGEFFF